MPATNRLPGVRRLVRWAANLALTALTLGAVAFLAPSLLGYQRYVITGGSMAGTIEKGSLVYARTVPAEELRVGDVITYEPPASSGVNWLVTHRIVEIGRDAQGRQVLRTKGDANAKPDPWTFSLTAPEQAVVAHAVPYVGWGLIGLADRETRMLVIGIPAGLIALLSLVQLIGALRRPTPFGIVESA